MMRFIIIIIAISSFLSSCKQKAPEKLVIGAWKVDSTYSFYNGFEMISLGKQIIFSPSVVSRCPPKRGKKRQVLQSFAISDIFGSLDTLKCWYSET